MTLAALNARLLRRYELLRTGQALRFGPVAVVRWKHLNNLLLRLKDAENALAGSGLITAQPFAVPTWSKAGPSGQRSVLFLHHSYYNFFYLAVALRRRGWDAVSASIEDPNGPHAKYYHGEDVNLFDRDPGRYQRNLLDFFSEVEARFRMVHFYGRGRMSFFPESFDNRPAYDVLPTDFIRLRQRGVKIGYSVCGCLDGVAQLSVNSWSGACDRCVWQHQRHVCADDTNLAWGHKLHLMCDLIATEGFPALDWQGKGDKLFREPLTTALDPDFWRPDLEIPEQYRLKRSPGELVVYHGVGNYDTRAREGRGIKGTGSVMAAIDRLRVEGVPVRLEFVTDMPNKRVRFIQVQADIVVDQLNYGRYGAQAREGMMLGRPTVCYINKSEPPGADRLDSIETCPLVSATEHTIYEVLKDLLGNEAKRRAIGEASRAFALKWHSASACAERFERVYDRLMQGQSPTDTRAYAAAE
jgi:hypothetical protein